MRACAGWIAGLWLAALAGCAPQTRSGREPTTPQTPTSERVSAEASAATRRRLEEPPPALKHWNFEDFGGVLSVGLEGHRDYANGKRQFIGLCGACHVLGAFGGGSAVDLTRRALTYTPEELLAHILNTASHPSPNGALLDRLPQERVLDLLAFVLAGTDASSPFFLQP